MANKTPKFKMIDDDLDPQVIVTEVLSIIDGWFTKEGITQTDVQKQMMVSHIQAMVLRAKTLEPLPEVDKTLFDEISPQSMALAEKTVDLFNTLPVEEAYLLSVHYEIARAN